LETGRRSGTGWFAQFGTVADQGADGLVEFGGERRVEQRDAVVVERGAGQGEHAGAEADLGRRDPQDEGRVCARAAVALPESQVEVRFIGRLVLGEAQIVGDAEQAANDPRLGPQLVGYPAAQFSAEGDDERLGGFEQLLLVDAAVGIEVPLGVIAFQPGKERQARGAESAEGGGISRLDSTGLRPPVGRRGRGLR